MSEMMTGGAEINQVSLPSLVKSVYILWGFVIMNYYKGLPHRQLIMEYCKISIIQLNAPANNTME